MAKTTDMTTGSPFKRILIFAIPIALGFMLQNLYSLGDSLIVSLALGNEAVTGVNLTGSLNFLIIGCGQGLSAGFGIVLSQWVGAKNQQKMRESFATSIVLTLIISAILTTFSIIFARKILELMQTDALYIDYSESYVKALFTGLTFSIFYNLSDQVMRAMGDSKTPLLILILCAILNIALNSLLFLNKDLGAAWAGWATIISQGVSASVGFFIILKRFKVLRPSLKDFKINFKFALSHLSVGLPMSFQFMITSISCMIQQGAFNSLDSPLYAMAQGTANKIDNVFSSILVGAANSMAVFCGQNFGAKKYDRIEQGAKRSLLVGIIYTFVASALAICLCRPFSHLLLSNAPDIVYDYVFQYILTQALLYYTLFVLLNYRQALQSMGKSFLAMFGGIVELFMRCFAAFILAENFGYTGACFSNVLAWFGAAVFFSICMVIVIKKLKTTTPTQITEQTN